MTEQKRFPLEDVLCLIAISKCLPPPDEPSDTLDDLNRWVRGLPSDTEWILHERWVMSAIICGIVLRKAHPALDQLEIPDFQDDESAYQDWLQKQRKAFGETILVSTTSDPGSLARYWPETIQIHRWYEENAPHS